LAVKELQLGLRRKLADEHRLQPFAGAWIGAFFGRRQRLRRGPQLPLMKDERRGGSFDRAADQQLVDLIKTDMALAEHLAVAAERLALQPLGKKRQSASIPRHGLNADAEGEFAGEGIVRRGDGIGGFYDFVRMERDDSRDL